MLANKTTRRTEILNRLKNTLTTPDVFKTVPYKTQKEGRIISGIYPYLVHEVRKLYQEYGGFTEKTAVLKTNKNLLWEGNINTTINHVEFFGGRHRPDIIVDFEEGFKIAVEVKRGVSGHSFRKGIGQCLVYTASFMADFAILLYIDISKEQKILKSIDGIYEKRFIKELWDDNNIMLVFV